MVQGLESIALPLIASGLLLATVVLNVYWLIWGFLYEGRGKRAVRVVWWVYLCIPFLVAVLFALSLREVPLANCPEPFGWDGRPYGYFALGTTFGSFAALIGVILMAQLNSVAGSGAAK